VLAVALHGESGSAVRRDPADKTLVISVATMENPIAQDGIDRFATKYSSVLVCLRENLRPTDTMAARYASIINKSNHRIFPIWSILLIDHDEAIIVSAPRSRASPSGTQNLNMCSNIHHAHVNLKVVFVL